MSYTVLAFPDLRDFIKHLKKRRIHQYGKVMIQKTDTGQQGIPIVSLTIRLSAKDDSSLEIIRCDLTFYRGIYHTRELLMKDSEKGRAEIDKYIIKIFKEERNKEPIKHFQFSELAAEFQPVKETEK